ncbi:MAG: enoyl-CoA hydratase/isomerase family protein [Proteobacteria bacterium]|nr:enoyl-CoA hydratase/isomerase family protein [Pseudomonadota bacterium]
MINLTKEGPVFILTLNDGENRWNTTFVRAIAKALDEVEASGGPAALVTTSSNEKFFSNGLDLDWIRSTGEHRGGDRTVFADEFMKLMGRLITLPIPTLCAINGHAFGAGFMMALCHDARIMRERVP